MSEVITEEIISTLKEKYLLHYIPSKFEKIDDGSLIYIYMHLLYTYDEVNKYEYHDSVINHQYEVSQQVLKHIIKCLRPLGLSYLTSKPRDLLDKKKSTRLLLALHDKIINKYGKGVPARARMVLKKELLFSKANQQQRKIAQSVPPKNCDESKEKEETIVQEKFLANCEEKEEAFILPAPPTERIIPGGWQIPRTPIKESLHEPPVTIQELPIASIPPPPSFGDTPDKPKEPSTGGGHLSLVSGVILTPPCEFQDQGEEIDLVNNFKEKLCMAGQVKESVHPTSKPLSLSKVGQERETEAKENTNLSKLLSRRKTYVVTEVSTSGDDANKNGDEFDSAIPLKTVASNVKDSLPDSLGNEKEQLDLISDDLKTYCTLDKKVGQERKTEAKENTNLSKLLRKRKTYVVTEVSTSVNDANKNGGEFDSAIPLKTVASNVKDSLPDSLGNEKEQLDLISDDLKTYCTLDKKVLQDEDKALNFMSTYGGIKGVKASVEDDSEPLFNGSSSIDKTTITRKVDGNDLTFNISDSLVCDELHGGEALLQRVRDPEDEIISKLSDVSLGEREKDARKKKAAVEKRRTFTVDKVYKGMEKQLYSPIASDISEGDATVSEVPSAINNQTYCLPNCSPTSDSNPIKEHEMDTSRHGELNDTLRLPVFVNLLSSEISFVECGKGKIPKGRELSRTPPSLDSSVVNRSSVRIDSNLIALTPPPAKSGPNHEVSLCGPEENATNNVEKLGTIVTERGEMEDGIVEEVVGDSPHLQNKPRNDSYNDSLSIFPSQKFRCKDEKFGLDGDTKMKFPVSNERNEETSNLGGNPKAVIDNLKNDEQQEANDTERNRGTRTRTRGANRKTVVYFESDDESSQSTVTLVKSSPEITTKQKKATLKSELKNKIKSAVSQTNENIEKQVDNKEEKTRKITRKAGKRKKTDDDNEDDVSNENRDKINSELKNFESAKEHKPLKLAEADIDPAVETEGHHYVEIDGEEMVEINELKAQRKEGKKSLANKGDNLKTKKTGAVSISKEGNDAVKSTTKSQLPVRSKRGKKVNENTGNLNVDGVEERVNSDGERKCLEELVTEVSGGADAGPVESSAATFKPVLKKSISIKDKKSKNLSLKKPSHYSEDYTTNSQSNEYLTNEKVELESSTKQLRKPRVSVQAKLLVEKNDCDSQKFVCDKEDTGKLEMNDQVKEEASSHRKGRTKINRKASDPVKKIDEITEPVQLIQKTTLKKAISSKLKLTKKVSSKERLQERNNVPVNLEQNEQIDSSMFSDFNPQMNAFVKPLTRTKQRGSTFRSKTNDQEGAEGNEGSSEIKIKSKKPSIRGLKSSNKENASSLSFSNGEVAAVPKSSTTRQKRTKLSSKKLTLDVGETVGEKSVLKDSQNVTNIPQNGHIEKNTTPLLKEKSSRPGRRCKTNAQNAIAEIMKDSI